MTNPKIQTGYLDIFYAFKLYDPIKNKSNKSNVYVNILKNLAESHLIISGENFNKAVYFSERFIDYLEDRKSRFREKSNFGKPIPNDLNTIKKLDENVKVYISPVEDGINLSFEDNIEDPIEISQAYYLDQLVSIYRDEERYTGMQSKDYKNRFLLFPPEIHKEENIFYPGIYLTVFKHGFAILHASIPLENLEIDEINKSMWAYTLSKVNLPEFMFNNTGLYKFKKKARCNNLFELIRVYSEYILTLLNKDTNGFEGEFFSNLTLTKYTYIPEEFKSSTPSNKYNEQLYKLLYAPIEDYALIPAEEINEFVENRFYSFSKYHRYYVNNNRSISVYSKNFLNALKNHYIEDSTQLSDPVVFNKLCHHGTLGGIINAIELMLLKKLSFQELSVFDIQEHTTLKKLIDIIIKENTNYSFEFSQYFFKYASVRSLVAFMEKNCEDFLQLNLMKQRRDRIERVINLKKERYIANFTALGPFLTITLTLILSFPTLQSILMIFNKETYLMEIYLSLNLTCILIFLYFFREQLNDSKIQFYTTTIPKLTAKYLKYATSLFLISYSIAAFMTLDVSSAWRLIKNKNHKKFNA